jgi:uncharacterized membrane protein YhaH (DUF805 family)
MQLDWQRLFLSADGRIGRQEYWVGFLILLGVGFVAKFIPFIGILISLALIYAQVCVGSKRLHDMGRSGFLMLIPYGVFVVALIVALMFGGMAMLAGMAGGDTGTAAAAVGAGLGLVGIMLLACLVSLGFIVWVGVTPSQPGENRYGPEPMAAPAPVPPPAV